MKAFRDEKRTQEINVNYWFMFRFREEKYTGQNSPRQGVIHFGTVQQG